MSSVLLVFVVLSLALLLWQWIEAGLFPLHRTRRRPGFAPGLTLLKPLKGCDAETERCLESWVAQDYAGSVQILFVVASQDDPVVPLVRRLINRYPHRDSELVCCPERLGPNSKVSKLAQAAPRAKHGILVVSDADVHVPPGFLAELVAPLAEPRVVLVNPFYQLANPATPAMRWEALAVNADFWSSVLQARRLGGLRFALGAVMAVRRDALERMGGFAALVNHLADDYELGKRLTAALDEPAVPGGARLLPSHPISDTDPARPQPRPTRFMAREQVRKEQAALDEPAVPGGARLLPSDPVADPHPARQQPRSTGFMATEQVQAEPAVPRERPSIELCPRVVACRESPHGWQAVWRHQLRWNRTIRHCQPLPYACSLLSNPTLWPVLWVISRGDTAGWIGFAGCLASRLAMAAHCQWRLTRSWGHLPWVWLAPLKDLLQAALWVTAFVGNTVEWRGERYRVLRGGELRLIECAPTQSTSPITASR